jgi:thymidine phosphorylase
LGGGGGRSGGGRRRRRLGRIDDGLEGAGRARVDSTIDPSAGLVFLRTVGDSVAKGDVIAEVHVNRTHALMVSKALAMLADATTITDAPPPTPSLILERL